VTTTCSVAARGGAPSELEKVNWIKMQVFQVRDPDGHTVWFGQSFQQPEGPKDPARQLRQATEFYVRDADALHAELTGRGARVEGEPVSEPWGLRTFRVLDRDGTS